MIGVSFQPGMDGYGQGGTTPQAGAGKRNPVQEAIKVLSLRLPKVVGARAISPQGLLESSGSDGSRVDSVVNQVLSRMFPTAAPTGDGGGGMPPMQAASFGMVPESSAPPTGPSFSLQPNAATPQTNLRREGAHVSYATPFGRPKPPNIVTDVPDFGGIAAAGAQPRPTLDWPVGPSAVASGPAFRPYEPPPEPEGPFAI